MSVSMIEAERFPRALGEKVTLIVQFPPAATEPLQVLVCAKSPELTPPTAMLLTLRAAFPMLFTVTVCAALVVDNVWPVKVRLLAVRLTVGPLPAPVRLTDCWLPGKSLVLSVMIKVAVRLPVALGLKVTLTVQLVPPANELPQVVVSPKSPGLPPVNAMLLIIRAAFPVLLSVNVWALLVVPVVWLGKFRLVAVMPAMGPDPVPVKFTV